MSRKAMTTTLNQELIKKAKKLAIDRNKNLNDPSMHRLIRW
jgi:hypothetical protein